KVADSIIVAPDDLNNHDSVAPIICEIRDQILKQTAKTHEDTVKEITKAHERTIETLWGAARGAAGTEADGGEPGESIGTVARGHPKDSSAIRAGARADAAAA
ncbi:unnamed protein product, partial [Clonostachys chloroleuca]